MGSLQIFELAEREILKNSTFGRKSDGHLPIWCAKKVTGREFTPARFARCALLTWLPTRYRRWYW